MKSKSYENLINNRDRTAEERVAFAKAGGKRSGEVRKRNKTLRETMKNLLKAEFTFTDPVTDSPTQGDGYDMWCAQVALGALKGDRKCLEYLRDIIGENPATKLVPDEETNSEIRITFVDKSDVSKKLNTDPKVAETTQNTTDD